MSAATLDCEIVIIGGGLAGMTMAAALGSAGVTTILVDRDTAETRLAPAFDGRTTALAFGATRLMQAIGAWEFMADGGEPILDIRVADDNAPLFLHYDHRDIGDDPLGWIIENRHIRWGLLQRLKSLSGTVQHLCPTLAAQIDRTQAGVSVTLADGRIITARLVIAADGRGSRLRQQAGIQTDRWGYGQQAIVCTVAHEEPHHGVAVEHFMPSGPFAILPLKDDAEGRHRSSIVWTEKERLVPYYMQMNIADFELALRRKFGDFWGRVSVLPSAGAASGNERFTYPLGLMLARRYISDRLALIGEAAHVVHPIAGQGFNLSVRDIAALAEAVSDARALGQDVGSPAILDRFERWRRFDVATLAGTTDILNRLFSNSEPVLKLARDLGLAAVGKVPPLKHFFMRHAMGTVGELPRLMRGETF
jgi:2-octaprenyl-6-methoxyphenol hydroxylase